jgi:hypothetical protein
MRYAAVVALALLLTGAARAQQSDPKPDYSREHLRQIFANIPDEPEPERRFQFHWGMLEFRALGTDWRIGILSPLVGSNPRTTKQWPDAFSLTGTVLPGALPILPDEDRDSRRERVRIERLQRAKIKVQAQ